MANQRGRRPASHLAIASNVTTLEITKRPAPPVGMPGAEAIIWRVVVDSMAADWFRPEQLPLLEQYCRHKVASDDIAGMIADLKRPSVDVDGAKTFQVYTVTYSELLKMQERETRTLSTSRNENASYPSVDL